MKFFERVKSNRAASFVIVAVVYVIATIAGIAVYNMLSFDWWLRLLAADIAATAITFVFSVIFGNASVYDPYWSVQPIVILVGFAIGTELSAYRLLLLAAVCFWGIRLTVNWGYNFYSLNHQDWRYTMLKEKMGIFYPLINFLGIHLVPTLVVYLCVLPAAYAMLHDGRMTVLSAVFICLSVTATVMQGTADVQMSRFRKQRTGRFIRTGLWKYSRHPNYLGEILMWWGIALSVISVFPNEVYLCAGAVANTLLFLVVSIPMADNRQSAKEGFAQYKKETRMLLPIKKHG